MWQWWNIYSHINLLGTHDYSLFRSSKCESVTPIRDVLDIHITSTGTADGNNRDEKDILNPYAFDNELIQLNNKELVCIQITATSFLQRMVSVCVYV